MKSFSTTSLIGELEKEDKMKELESLLETQKCIMEKQNQRIQELEEIKTNQTKISHEINVKPIYEEKGEMYSPEDSKKDDEIVEQDGDVNGCTPEQKYDDEN